LPYIEETGTIRSLFIPNLKSGLLMANQINTELELPEYEALATVLLDLGVYDEPARAHGLLCGLIVSTGGIETDEWLKALGPAQLTWHLVEQESREHLAYLIETTLSQFRDPEFQFSLLLPDEYEGLDERVRAFGIWCEGFIKGATREGNYFKLPNSPEIEEMMTDLREMSSIDDEVSEEEEQERAFFELQEYVKVAVLLLQSEFAELRDTTKKVTEPLH
jgi:yecA family protein